MTKAELRDHLKAGYSMDDAFDFVPGQDCDIFKADQFRAGDLNMIPRSTFITDDESIDEVVGNCYTGNDFIEECNGSLELAERLFWYCDWQHPSSAVDEVIDDD